MAQAFAPALQVNSKTVVKKLRELPVRGEILKKVGEKVAATEIVARVFLPGDLFILRLPEKMDIEPFEVLKGLKVKEGDRVVKGQLLCEHLGLFSLFKSRYFSPEEGDLEFIAPRTGHIGLRTAAKPLEIDAYISGEVCAVDPEKSLTIQSAASLAQGIFGVGGERKGKLEVLDLPVSKCLTPSDLPSDCLNKILIGGTKPSIEFIRAAAQAGALGLVVGSIDDQALKSYLGYDLGIALTGNEDIPMTIIVSEGFGEIPISERIISLFKQHHGKLCSINGATQVRAGAQRPEVIVCLENGAEASRIKKEEPLELKIGARVRMIRFPYFGLIGTITELPHEAATIATGAMARVLRARIEDGRILEVPRANVELI